MEPDLAGFAEAQSRLTQKVGDSVVLLRPLPSTYPPGTKFDPESGEPLDPWVRATASGFASAQASASVSFKPLGSDEAKDEQGPLGVKGTQRAAVILDPAEYDRAMASAATRVLYADRLYVVRDRTKDKVPSRYILFIEPL